MRRKIQTTGKYLRRRFLRVILATIGFMVLPILLIVLTQTLTENAKKTPIRAWDRLKSSYREIDVSDHVSDGGSAMVVDDELNVIPLGGDPLVETDRFSTADWTGYLQEIGRVSKYEYDVAYHEGEEGYWLVLRKPKSVTLNLSLFFNPEAKEYRTEFGAFMAIFSVYVIALIIFVILYSKKAAKKMTDSLEKVYDDAKKIEKGQYDIDSFDGKTLEIDALGKAMKHLAGQMQEKEELQKERERLQKEEEEKRMLLVSELSHDLKTPLASTQGYSELLLGSDVPDEKREEYLGIIYANSVRSNEIIQSLFTYSKLGSAGYQPTMERVDICEYSRQIVAEYFPRFEAARFTLDVMMPEDEIFVMLCKELFRRVYDNLFENALKYNPSGTKFEVKLKALKDTPDQVEIIVADHGTGIPKDAVEHIFEPFYRVNRNRLGVSDKENIPGSGLGLAIVKKIVEMHGGEITFEAESLSEREETDGCNFRIRIPRMV